MRAGWQNRTIEEVCEVVNGGTPKTGVSDYWGGGHQWVTPAEMGKRNSPFIAETERTLTDVGIANSSARSLPPMSVILSSRAPIGHLVINTKPMSFNQGCKGLIPRSGLHYKYLYYFLHANIDLLNSLGTGATFKELSSGKLKSVPIPVPPLEEQKRIVAVLDKAFEGIAKAAANAERNLGNAQGLFESCLSSATSAEGEQWTEANIGQLVAEEILDRPIDGNHGDIHPKKADFVKSGIPFVMASDLAKGVVDQDRCNFISETQARSLRKGFARDGDVLLSHKGTIGRVALLETEHPFVMLTPQVTYYRTLKPEVLDRRYLYFALQEQKFQAVMGHIAGAGSTRAYIGITKQLELPLRYPDIATQRRLVEKLEAVASYSRSLEQIYSSKLAGLANLQYSLMNKAFLGQLTSDKSFRLVVKARDKESTASPEYTADILAFAYIKHRAAQRDRTFGRVKGQKVLHLVEAIAGVDLGREPIKDAAGPNDSGHMRHAEDWAIQNGYFAFEARETGGYSFKPGQNFEKTLAGAHARLSSNKDAITKVINLLVPMDTQEAEVLATVHAAWNNLIIDGIEPTQDAIIAEARDNWTASKLEIPVEKFEHAIHIIRQNGIIPDGSSKPVRKQQESLF